MVVAFKGESPDDRVGVYLSAAYLTNRKDIATKKEEPATPVRILRCNAGAVRRAARKLTHFYDTELAPAGLNLCQYGILSAINSRGPALPSVQELAEELVLDRSTLGQNLRPLERARWISLVTDPNDRRVRLIALTRLGVAKFQEANKYWQIAQERFEAIFGTTEAAELRSTLASIAYHPELGKPPRLRQTSLVDEGLRRPGTPRIRSSSL
jgi:DNA-binding MarR family transcriptional regulator